MSYFLPMLHLPPTNYQYKSASLSQSSGRRRTWYRDAILQAAEDLSFQPLPSVGQAGGWVRGRSTSHSAATLLSQQEVGVKLSPD